MQEVSSSSFIQALKGGAQVLQPGPRVLASELVDDIQRARLIAGMAEAAAEKGYAATTIADVVSRAQVSRRTFYEHFDDKDACFLAAYDASADLLMAFVAEAVEDPDLTWQERIAAGVSTYLNTLAHEPALTRVFLIEVLAAGPPALKRRRAVHQRFAELVHGLVEAHRDELPENWSLDSMMAAAIIGAIDELALIAVEDGRAAELPHLASTAVHLVQATLAMPQPTGIATPARLAGDDAAQRANTEGRS